LTWPVSPSTFRKGANSGGPPDSSDRIQSRLKSLGLKGSNSRPSLARAKEKLTGLSQRASGLRQHCELGTEARGIFHVAADIFSAEPIAALWDWTLAIGPLGKAWRPTAFPKKTQPWTDVLGLLVVVVSGQMVRWQPKLVVAPANGRSFSCCNLHCAHPVL